MEELVKRISKKSVGKTIDEIVEALKKDIENYNENISDTDLTLMVANVVYDIALLEAKAEIDGLKLLGALEYRNLIEEGKIDGKGNGIQV